MQLPAIRLVAILGVMTIIFPSIARARPSASIPNGGALDANPNRVAVCSQAATNGCMVYPKEMDTALATSPAGLKLKDGCADANRQCGIKCGVACPTYLLALCTVWHAQECAVESCGNA